MNILHFGSGKYTEEAPQLRLEGNKIPPNSQSSMMYSWINPTTGKIYNRITSNSLEISIMTESRFHDLFEIKACITREDTGLDYYGRMRESEFGIIVIIDTDRIHSYRDKSDSLRAYLSKLFETIPVYSVSNHPQCENKSFLPTLPSIEQPSNFTVTLYDYQKKKCCKND